MTHVAIVGAGIIGATCALMLARAGARVTLIDPEDQARQASVGSLAWLNVSSTMDRDYAALRQASLRLWHDLKSEAPECPAWFNGALLWHTDAAQLAAQAASLADLGWPAEFLHRAALTERLPQFNAPEAALFAPYEGYAAPARITGWMRTAAESAGATAIQSVVSALSPGEVHLADGPRVTADAILVTAGSATPELLAPLDIHVPLRRSPGITMATAATRLAVPHVMASPRLDYWQGSDGRLLMSSSLSKTPNRADEMVAEDAMQELRRLYPGAAVPPVEHVLRRDRPIPEDGFPIIGSAGRDGIFLAVMHSGMTLAPVVAAALTDQILDRPQRFETSKYRLNRDWTPTHERAFA